MAETLNTPSALSQPIAQSGDKNTIPVTNDQSLGLMSQSTGFPPITSVRIADGGKAPRRADFNGAFNLLSQQHYFFQNGGTETFRQEVSDAIGGYPLGARLWYTNSEGMTVVLRSLIQNNTFNFNSNSSYIDGIHWEVDIQSGAPVGSLMPYAGTTPPDGWLICDGSEISRTSYSRLFAVIGTTYGAGDGNSSFNLPDFQGRYLGGNGQGYVPESLPNITGSFTSTQWDTVTTSGAFSQGSITSSRDSADITGNIRRTILFNAADSSSTYQDGAKVKPDTLLCNLVIKY